MFVKLHVCVCVTVPHMCGPITLCILPKDFFYLLLCLKQPALLLRSQTPTCLPVSPPLRVREKTYLWKV